ncbi:MAG: DMT family transporter [Candidatus Hermodarchaeota archaeon]
MSLVFYWLGILLAISSGISNNYGTVLQKKVVNRFKDDSKFMRTIVKKPLWLIGLILQTIIGGLLYFVAQFFIGPTLIPGLMGAGLIVLAIGSVKIVGEQLESLEIVGIFLMVIAIAFIGLSNMAINVEAQNFLEWELLLRIIVFTIVLFTLAGIFYLLQIKGINKGISLAICSGFMFALSNFWISPLMGVLSHVFGGSALLTEILIFIFSLIVLAFTNIFGITTIQKSFRVGQASNLIPIQQIPIQIAPPFYFLVVYFLPIPGVLSLIFLIIGIGFVIVSSFLLGKRQTQIESIK